MATSPTAVIDFLAELSRHRGIHPYLESAVVVQTGMDASGAWTEWRVVERPRLGPLRYRIRFGARMIRSTASSLVGVVHAAPGCDLTTSTRAVRTADRTVVTESTTVTAPLPLVGYMTAQARIAHTRTFALLSRELDDAG